MICRAGAEEADLLLFPEILGTKSIQEEIEAALYENESEYPRMTICPSIWKRNKNSCRILDEMGMLLAEQEKHFGAQLGGKLEDIKSNQKVYLFHCEGIGRIAVLICMDFLVNTYREFVVKELKATLVLVPSYSSGEYNFETKAMNYMDLDCQVIWINCCSAAKGKNEPITLRYGAGRKGVYRERKMVNELCGEHCTGECLWIYEIELEGGTQKEKETGWDFHETLEMLNGLSEKSQEEIKTYIAVVKSRNQTYIRSTVQAVEEQDYATVDQIVKECKRAQKQ